MPERKKPEQSGPLYWKLPPKEKIYEAFSVIADERYSVISEGKATVTSSSGDKQYALKWNMNGDAIKITSNDNASLWQGYTGYPIIAMLMLLGRISYNREMIRYFKGIPWKKINKAHRNNYSEAVDEILNGLNDPELVKKIRESVDDIYNQIGDLKPLKLARGR